MRVDLVEQGIAEGLTTDEIVAKARFKDFDSMRASKSLRARGDLRSTLIAQRRREYPPSEHPGTVARREAQREAGRVHRARVISEVQAHLDSEPVEDLAKRLGYARAGTMANRIARFGRPDLAELVRTRANIGTITQRRAAEAEQRKYIIGEVRFLIDTDGNESLARRLGYASASSLARTLYRWGEESLAVRIDPSPDDLVA